MLLQSVHSTHAQALLVYDRARLVSAASAASAYASNNTLQSGREPSSTTQPENDATRWPGRYVACRYHSGASLVPLADTAGSWDDSSIG